MAIIALQKDKILEIGFTANYWIITQMTMNNPSQSGIIVMGLWKDKAAFDSGKTQISTEQNTIEFSNEIGQQNIAALEQGANVYDLIYQYLLTLPEWTDATPVYAV